MLLLCPVQGPWASSLVHLSRRLKCTIMITRHPWLLTFHIFDFCETARRNSTKLDRKQDLNVLYQVVFFRPIKKKDGSPASDWLRHFVFSETAEWNSRKLDRKQDLNILLQVCVLRADQKNKMATFASDWPRHFRLLLFKVVLNTDPQKNFVIQTPWNLSGIYKKVHYVDLANKIDSPREYFRVLYF